jgi:hypothetical protein
MVRLVNVKLFMEPVQFKFQCTEANFFSPFIGKASQDVGACSRFFFDQFEQVSEFRSSLKTAWVMVQGPRAG